LRIERVAADRSGHAATMFIIWADGRPAHTYGPGDAGV
jgi:hypothetical protein